MTEISTTPDGTVTVQLPGPQTFVYASQAERDRAVRLAQARQYLAHQAIGVPGWADLTVTEQETATLEARHWVRAAEDAGLIARAAVSPATRGRAVIMLDDGMVSDTERANAIAMAASLAQRDGTVTELAVREGVQALIVPTSDGGRE